MCGEKKNARLIFVNLTGSPPHVRGKDWLTKLWGMGHGITPACAGKRSWRSLRTKPVQDHPRMCGEKSCNFRFAFCHPGSPPHVRGKDGRRKKRKPCIRITPACAGKSLSLFHLDHYIRDHPRMCGEKQILTYARIGNAGSPPHVRGKVLCQPIRQGIFRITPACAGKSSSHNLCVVLHGDHPRMCGEKSLILVNGGAFMGSPPHVRGKVPCRTVWWAPSWITPACAGKRVFHDRAGLVKKDHPRMCGEKPTSYITTMVREGSPPHVRGKEIGCRSGQSLHGITPACAGKSSAHSFMPMMA